MHAYFGSLFLKRYDYAHNHENCDCFEKLLFSTNSLAKLLLDSLLSDSSRSHQIQSFSLNQSITFKVVGTYNILWLLCQSFNAIVPFLS